MLNRVILIGRLVRDPELRYLTSGTALCTFALAVERQFKREGQPDADFIDILTFQKLAESCSKYLAKGSMCAVEGRLQIRSYTDSQGVNRKAAEIVADNVRFLSTKKQEQQQEPQEAFGEPVAFDDEDIPF